uniref:Uncharacterized protein n=1 Tax=viral metagenome TaxID=1070528 RepID=A0A6C0I3Y5_9ZZZZ
MSGQFNVAPNRNGYELYFQPAGKFNPGKHFNLQHILSENIDEIKMAELPVTGSSAENNDWINRVASCGSLIYEHAIRNSNPLKAKILPKKYLHSIELWEILVLFEKEDKLLKSCLRHKESGDLLLLTSTSLRSEETTGKTSESIDKSWSTYTVALYAVPEFWIAVKQVI